MKLIAVVLTLIVASPALAEQPRWIVGTALGIKVCDAPAGPLDTRCEYVKTGKLVVDGEAPGTAPRLRFYHVRFENGRAGYIGGTDMEFSTTATDPAIAAAACKAAGIPQVGMTVEQVKATCWGRPGHVNRTAGAGTTLDQFVYGNSRYVYVRDGIVESVQSSGRLR